MALAVLPMHVNYKSLCSIKPKLGSILEISFSLPFKLVFLILSFYEGTASIKKELPISLCAVRSRRQCK